MNHALYPGLVSALAAAIRGCPEPGDNQSFPSLGAEYVNIFGHPMDYGKYVFYMTNFICELFFILDIVLEFRTGFLEEETDEVCAW